MLQTFRSALHRSPDRRTERPTATPAKRLAAASEAAAEAHAVTGWDYDGLLEQSLEDTCRKHGRWCCPACSATQLCSEHGEYCCETCFASP